MLEGKALNLGRELKLLEPRLEERKGQLGKKLSLEQ